MRKIKILLLSLTVLAVTNSFAQKSDSKSSSDGTTFSIGVEGALPLGDLKDGWKFGIGGSAKVAIPVFTGGAVTISAGYITYSGKEETETILGTSVTFKNPTLNTIPLKAGLRFMISNGFYGEPQLGYTIATVKDADGNANGFTYAANLGYMINNMVDISARYEGWSKSENGSSFSPSFIGLRLAYSFGK